MNFCGMFKLWSLAWKRDHQSPNSLQSLAFNSLSAFQSFFLICLFKKSEIFNMIIALCQMESEKRFVSQSVSRKLKLLLRSFDGSSNNLLATKRKAVFSFIKLISFQPQPCEDYHRKPCNHSKTWSVVTLNVKSQNTLFSTVIVKMIGPKLSTSHDIKFFV